MAAGTSPGRGGGGGGYFAEPGRAVAIALEPELYGQNSDSHRRGAPHQPHEEPRLCARTRRACSLIPNLEAGRSAEQQQTKCPFASWVLQDGSLRPGSSSECVLPSCLRVAVNMYGSNPAAEAATL